MRRWISAVVLCALVSGCAAVVVGAGAAAGFVWATGSLKGSLDAPLPEVEDAATTAFEELRFVAVEAEPKGLKSKLRARMADGTRVTVRLEAEDFEHTTVAIRVGLVGDRAISEQILKHLQRAL